MTPFVQIKNQETERLSEPPDIPQKVDGKLGWKFVTYDSRVGKLNPSQTQISRILCMLSDSLVKLDPYG